MVPESYYDWDGVNVVRERNMDGTASERRVPGHAAVPGVGQIAQVEKVSGGSASQYVPAFDQVGTTWKLVGAGGTVANSYAYDAFGTGRGQTEAVTELYRYGGRRYVQEVDEYLPMYHYVTRSYEPELGRFAERDVEALEVRNAHTYARSDPLANTDPTGLQCEPIADAAGAAASLQEPHGGRREEEVEKPSYGPKASEKSQEAAQAHVDSRTPGSD